MKITPRLVDHSVLKPKPNKMIHIPTNSEPFFTWKLIINLFGLCILAIAACVLYERYIFKENHDEQNVKQRENTLSYIQNKLK